MGAGANVRSLEAIRRFRPALIQFETEAALVLGSLRQDVDRTLQWLDHDCPRYWQQQVRTAFDRVGEARTQLARKQMITVAGHHASCIEEKKALEIAKQRLEYAQEKLRAVRRWSIKAHHAADEFKCQLGRVEQELAAGCPRALAALDHILAALTAYVSDGSSFAAESDPAASAAADTTANFAVQPDQPTE